MKYPRTPHLPWSPGATRDDRIMNSVEPLLDTDIVITEKIDGSNLCFTKRDVFARSHAGPPGHPSFDQAKAKHAEINYRLLETVQVFMEYTYAVHSIEYTKMQSFFWVIGVLVADTWASFPAVGGWASVLNLPTVPVLYTGRVSSRTELQCLIDKLAVRKSSLGGPQEGLVVRCVDNFHTLDFPAYVAKYVRADHIQTDEHWSRNWRKAEIHVPG